MTNPHNSPLAGALAERLRTRARLAADYLACGHQTQRLLAQRSLLQSARLQFLLALLAGLQRCNPSLQQSAPDATAAPEERDGAAVSGGKAALASVGFDRSALAPDTRLLLAHLDAETVALLVAQLRADLLPIQESMKLTKFFDLCNAAVRASNLLQ